MFAMHLCALLYVLAASVVGSPSPGLFGEVAARCEAAVDFASHPLDRVAYAVRDAEDFLQFPDKSKQEQKNFTTEEVSKFDGEDGRHLYLVFDGQVYDVTDFADMHPGGPAPLRANAGRDASAVMRAAGMPDKVFTHFIQIFRVGQIADS